jgi:hypothetical protein
MKLDSLNPSVPINIPETPLDLKAFAANTLISAERAVLMPVTMAAGAKPAGNHTLDSSAHQPFPYSQMHPRLNKIYCTIF